VINAWLKAGYGRYHVQLGKRMPPAFMVPVLRHEPVAFAVRRTFLAIRAPVLGMLGLPMVLASSWVRPVLGLSGACGPLPRGFSRALAGVVGAETLRLHPGIRPYETSAMGTAHGAVHGFLLRAAGYRKTRLSQEA
jgi:hypothetical protein